MRAHTGLKKESCILVQGIISISIVELPNFLQPNLLALTGLQPTINQHWLTLGKGQCSMDTIKLIHILYIYLCIQCVIHHTFLLEYRKKWRPAIVGHIVNYRLFVTQIARTLRFISIKHQSDISTSDWCLINVNPRVFATWEVIIKQSKTGLAMT